MRFTNFILAAGLTASAFAAPVAVPEDDDSCPGDVAAETTSATLVAATSAISSKAIAPSTIVKAIAPSSSAKASASSAIAEASSSVQGISVASSAISTPVAVSSSAIVVASSTAATNAAVPSTGSTAVSSGKLKWIGASESGAEFGTGSIPGTLGTDYIFPTSDSIQTLVSGGMNMIRIPFLLERMAPGAMTASLDATYLAGIKTVVTDVTSLNAHAILDAHNAGRYDGSVFTSTSDFAAFWTKLATEFADNSLVVFDCNNEFHDEPTNTIVAELNQACVTAVRAAGATSQYIFVEGTAYTGAWTWTSSGNAQYMTNITDPNDKLIYEFHQYLDNDGSGTSDVCVSSTIGAERIAVATAWLKANNFKGILGEYAGGVNSVCQSAIVGMLDALAADNTYWLGALWWGAGPWWGNYIYAFEPPSGTAYTAYYDTIVGYVA